MAAGGSPNKRDLEKKRQQKQEEKQRRKEERKANSGGGGLESMMAYVDENGQLTSTPPDPTKRKEIALEDIEIGVPRREHEEVSNDRIGRIDFFDTSKGFGFIKEEGTQERFFVHISNLLDEVQANDKVVFETERSARGMSAVRVRKA